MHTKVLFLEKWYSITATVALSLLLSHSELGVETIVLQYPVYSNNRRQNIRVVHTSCVRNEYCSTSTLDSGVDDQMPLSEPTVLHSQKYTRDIRNFVVTRSKMTFLAIKEIILPLWNTFSWLITFIWLACVGKCMRASPSTAIQSPMGQNCFEQQCLRQNCPTLILWDNFVPLETAWSFYWSCDTTNTVVIKARFEYMLRWYIEMYQHIVPILLCSQ